MNSLLYVAMVSVLLSPSSRAFGRDTEGRALPLLKPSQEAHIDRGEVLIEKRYKHLDSDSAKFRVGDPKKEEKTEATMIPVEKITETLETVKSLCKSIGKASIKVSIGLDSKGGIVIAETTLKTGFEITINCGG